MSLETLNAEVEALKARQVAAGSTPRDTNGRAMPIAGTIPEVQAVMERAHAKWRARCAEVIESKEYIAAPARKGCSDHPHIMLDLLSEETCQATHYNGYFIACYSPCQECTGAEARKQQRNYWSRRGVPERVIEATLGNFKADTDDKVTALGKVRDWIKLNGTFLLLAGTPGTGKGHLATGCLKAQGNGLFITQPAMLGDLRASYTLHNTKEVIERWQEAEMLVLDEFGLSPGGKDEEPMLYQVFADRYDRRRPTIITSNLELPQLREAIGFRLLDRIQENCATVVCRWPSRRTGK